MLSRKKEATALGLSMIPARVALGSALVFHGAAKLGSDKPRQMAGFFEDLGIRPGKPWVIATGLTEVLSGALSILGIGTRLAALGVLVTQGVAVTKVHLRKGYDHQKGGFEYNLALIAMALGLLVAGPGHVSLRRGVERLLEGRRAPRRWLRRAVPPRTLGLVHLLQ